MDIFSFLVLFNCFTSSIIFQEATDLWEQLSVLTMTISNKFTEFDTRIKEIEKRVDKNESKN